MDASTLNEFKRAFAPHGIKVCDMTLVVERDANNALQMLDPLSSMLGKLFLKAKANDKVAFVFLNTRQTRRHGFLIMNPYIRKCFESKSPWALLHKDNCICPEKEKTNSVERSVSLAIGEETCPICLEALIDDYSIVLPTCYHSVHKACMDKCPMAIDMAEDKIKFQKHCPICRAPSDVAVMHPLRR